MTRAGTMVGVFGALAALLVGACGSSRSGFDPNGSTGDPTTPAASATPAQGSAGSASGGLGSSSGSTDADGGGGVGESCAAASVTATQLQLDLYMLIDTSGSMDTPTGASGNGPKKWAAVRDALKGFINDAKSAGIGVGLQFFPIQHAGAPDGCASSAQCQVGGVSYGRCMMKVCAPKSPTAPLVSCDTDADCPGSACRQFGECITGWGSIPTGAVCLKNDPTYGTCVPGSCTPYTRSICDGTACFDGDYGTPAVAMDALPGNSGRLVSALDAKQPEGQTPTASALRGALLHAKQFAFSNPGHAVVVVLATDGLPTQCAPLDMKGIADIVGAANGATPSIKTAVIGVFADNEKAQATTNLNSWAAAGGTGSAFMISTTSGNLTAEFQKALDTIRGVALPCEYAIPKPASGTPDYSRVNVQHTSTAGAQDLIGYRPNGCDAQAGGWHYDVDPNNGATPTKIVLCPTTCDAVKKDAGGKVDVLLGCKTQFH